MPALKYPVGAASSACALSVMLAGDTEDSAIRKARNADVSGLLDRQGGGGVERAAEDKVTFSAVDAAGASMRARSRYSSTWWR